MDKAQPTKSSRGRAMVRGTTLGCAFIGLLLALIWPIIDLTSWRNCVDNIPNWLGVLLTFFMGCYIYWEVRLSLEQQDERERKGGGSQVGLGEKGGS